MSIETYQQALDFWFSRINYEQRGMPVDLRVLNLDRMRALLARLGNPEKRLRILHVAGSKGKGSTAAMLAAVLQAAGHRVGLFTSPHLCRVEERCQVNGVAITPVELTTLMRDMEPVVNALERREASAPTFFEIVTALGFFHFVRRRVEVAVIEVGLGGRFDSTNVCSPLLSIITSISFDHMQQLGFSLAAIAREKAGIIKPGRPVVSGVTDPAARRVITEVAAEASSPLTQMGADFGFDYQAGVWAELNGQPSRVSVRTRCRLWPEMELALWGFHQGANAAVALAAIEEIRQQGFCIPDDAVRHGLSRVRWPARIEVVSARPLVILDCAHNAASIQALVDTLQQSFPSLRQSVVFACSRDKDLTGMAAILARNFQRAYFTRYTTSGRGASADELAHLWRQAGGGPCEVLDHPSAAWEAARAAALPDETICITGSVFIAGELRNLLGNRSSQATAAPASVA